MGKDKVHISILELADDAFLFCKYNDETLNTLIRTIEFFEWCSGQKVNGERSGGCCPCHVGCVVRLNLCLFVHWLSTKLPKERFFFLADMKFRRNWIDGNDLAYLKVEDLFCTNYYMSSFLMPEKVIVIIERIMKSFF